MIPVPIAAVLDSMLLSRSYAPDEQQFVGVLVDIDRLLWTVLRIAYIGWSALITDLQIWPDSIALPLETMAVQHRYAGALHRAIRAAAEWDVAFSAMCERVRSELQLLSEAWMSGMPMDAAHARATEKLDELVVYVSLRVDGALYRLKQDMLAACQAVFHRSFIRLPR